MKQHSSSELNRKLTNNETKVLILEEYYMKSLVKLFKDKKFLNSLNELVLYVNDQYNFLKTNYAKKNKIEIAVERLLRYHLYRNYKKVRKVYPSPISSDIAFETKDAIINLDSKTLDEHGNKTDFNFFHFESNQSSFNQETIGKTTNFPGLPILSSLPKNDVKTNKPILSFVIRILYSDNNSSFKLYSDNKNEGMSITCLPNGELSSLFKNNIVIGCKDYKYNKQGTVLIGKTSTLNTKGINFSQNFDDFNSYRADLSSANFIIPQSWNNEIKIFNKYGFYDDTNEKAWVIVRRGKGTANHVEYFENIIRGHTPRIEYDSLKNRLNNKNETWLGHVQWNITSELKKKWW